MKSTRFAVGLAVVFLLCPSWATSGWPGTKSLGGCSVQVGLSSLGRASRPAQGGHKRAGESADGGTDALREFLKSLPNGFRQPFGTLMMDAGEDLSVLGDVMSSSSRPGSEQDMIRIMDNLMRPLGATLHSLGANVSESGELIIPGTRAGKSLKLELETMLNFVRTLFELNDKSEQSYT